ncbi:unnamed protein product [Nesidiocoris tenuis]|uniref:Uncharacterized protein n=1 Tax=Nesidiocoris tenuis TaxID=355587 RepID=A0A6H5HJR9_9HEMI|nr:unnamed protein product [Nesidiocoris tenuis]
MTARQAFLEAFYYISREFNYLPCQSCSFRNNKYLKKIYYVTDPSTLQRFFLLRTTKYRVCIVGVSKPNTKVVLFVQNIYAEQEKRVSWPCAMCCAVAPAGRSDAELFMKLDHCSYVHFLKLDNPLKKMNIINPQSHCHHTSNKVERVGTALVFFLLCMLCIPSSLRLLLRITSRASVCASVCPPVRLRSFTKTAIAP